jgi:hypothetical protein
MGVKRLDSGCLQTKTNFHKNSLYVTSSACFTSRNKQATLKVLTYGDWTEKLAKDIKLRGV